MAKYYLTPYGAITDTESGFRVHLPSGSYTQFPVIGGAISASTSLLLTQVSDLKSKGSLTGNSNVVISTLSDLNGIGSLAATPILTLNTVSLLKAKGDLAAVITSLISSSAVLTDKPSLTASVSMSFSSNGLLDANGKLTSAQIITFTSNPLLKGKGDLTSTSTISITSNVTGLLRRLAEAAESLVFSSVSNLLSASNLFTNIVITITASAKPEGADLTFIYELKGDHVSTIVLDGDFEYLIELKGDHIGLEEFTYDGN